VSKAYESRDASLTHAGSLGAGDERFAFARAFHWLMVHGGIWRRRHGTPALGEAWRAVRPWWPLDLLSLPLERRPQRPLFIRIVLTYWPDMRDVTPSVWAYFGIGSGLTDVVRGGKHEHSKARFETLVKDWRRDIKAVAKELGLAPVKPPPAVAASESGRSLARITAPR
jgi:hypothetical protein